LTANNPYLVFSSPREREEGGRAVACPQGRYGKVRVPSRPEIVELCFFTFAGGYKTPYLSLRSMATAWTAAALEIVHYFSMFILVGSMVIVDLRVLGLVGRRQDATQLADWLFPWMWTSLALNALSGFFMFAGSATAYYGNDIFYDKMTVLLLAIVANIIVQKKVRKWNLLPAMPRGQN